MKTVKIYGSVCKHCGKTEALVKEAAARFCLVVGVQEIIGSKLVHAGGLPEATKIDNGLST